MEIEVGYGLEGVINDAKAGEILDKYVVPFFKQGKFGEGLYNGAAAIAEEIVKSSGQELEAGYRPQPVKQQAIGESAFFWIAMVAIILVVILSIFASGIASGLLGAVFGALFGFAFWGLSARSLERSSVLCYHIFKHQAHGGQAEAGVEGLAAAGVAEAAGAAGAEEPEEVGKEVIGMWKWLVGILVVVLLIGFWTVGIYNNLVGKDQLVKTSWAQIESQLQRRYDLIPNLVETVKGYAAHEKQLFENVAAARSAWAAARPGTEKSRPPIRSKVSWED